MATDKEYIEFVVEQLSFLEDIRYKKMFGEYCVYHDNNPSILVCDNTCYLKINEKTDKYLTEKGFPYKGAKLHYILDIENAELLQTLANEKII